jgi:hypothetical protein
MYNVFPQIFILQCCCMYCVSFRYDLKQPKGTCSRNAVHFCTQLYTTGPHKTVHSCIQLVLTKLYTLDILTVLHQP